MTAESIVEALAGRFDRWRWSPGLTPSAVGESLGVTIEPGEALFCGEIVQQAVITVDMQPQPVRMRWDRSGELIIAELRAPTAAPSWEFVIDALGAPDVVLEHGRGPYPGSDQRCHLGRGLTVFDGAGLGYQAVWLYPPMTAEEYPSRTGAFEPVHRPRR